MNRVDKIKAYKTQQEEKAMQENIQKENTHALQTELRLTATERDLTTTTTDMNTVVFSLTEFPIV